MSIITLYIDTPQLQNSPAILTPIDGSPYCYYLTLPSAPVTKVRAFVSIEGNDFAYEPLPYRDQEELGLLTSFFNKHSITFRTVRRTGR